MDTQADSKEVALEVVTQEPIQELTPRVVVLEVDTQELTPRVVVLEVDIQELTLRVVDLEVVIPELTPRVVVLEVVTQEPTPRVEVSEVVTKEATQEHTHRVLMAEDTMASVVQIKDPVRPEVLWEEVKKSNPNPKAMQRLSQQNRFQDDKTVLPNGGHYTTQW